MEIKLYANTIIQIKALDKILGDALDDEDTEPKK